MPSPRRIQSAKYRITVLVVTALAILAELIYLLSGGTWLKPKTHLRTYLADSTGLDPGASVELSGVEIGEVEALRLTDSKDPNRVVEARLKIEEKFLRHIPEDSVTAIASETLLGDEYIDITMGHSPRPVRPGGELHFRPPTNLLKSIDLAQFDVQLKTIDQIIRDAQAGKGSLGEFVVSDQLYRDVLSKIAGVEQSLKAATDTHSLLGQLLYSAKMSDGISASLRELDDGLAKLAASPYLRDSKQYGQIRDQIAKLRSALPKDELFTSDADYVEWNRRLAAWIESVDALNSGEGGIGQMLVNAQTYESLAGAMQNFETTVKAFREDPQKFLRVKIF
jgi:phospholipid/cholesterol/gamma-HCH transport system substrate-binding protein